MARDTGTCSSLEFTPGERRLSGVHTHAEGGWGYDKEGGRVQAAASVPAVLPCALPWIPQKTQTGQ